MDICLCILHFVVNWLKLLFRIHYWNNVTIASTNYELHFTNWKWERKTQHRNVHCFNGLVLPSMEFIQFKCTVCFSQRLRKTEIPLIFWKQKRVKNPFDFEFRMHSRAWALKKMNSNLLWRAKNVYFWNNLHFTSVLGADVICNARFEFSIFFLFFFALRLFCPK